MQPRQGKGAVDDQAMVHGSKMAPTNNLQVAKVRADAPLMPRLLWGNLVRRSVRLRLLVAGFGYLW